MEERTRQPVVVVLGHVDSGKTSLLDKIRGTAVQAREVGGMTQHIGASFFPIETLKQICGPLLSAVRGEVRIPGLLVIDTPGHEIFANLRMRGSSAADIAILVVDVLKGFEVQTYESVEILKSRKVPFAVALNKIDAIPGWRKGKGAYLVETLKLQEKAVVDDLDKHIYGVVGTLPRLGFNSEAFYRVKDFTREIAIVPTSARTGDGIPELIAVLVGLTQQYLRNRLASTLGPVRGIVLEVKEEPGLGPTADVIILDGLLRVGDTIAAARRDGALATKVRALLMPKPLDEMRDPRDRFTAVTEVPAAAGVKVVSPDLEGVLSGSILLGVSDQDRVAEAMRQIEEDVKSVIIEEQRLGVVVKADALGSLEAMVDMLKRRGASVRSADIGSVSRRDIVEASAVRETDPYLGVILAFGVRVLPDAVEEAGARGIKVFTDPVIYNLIETYFDWATKEREAAERRAFEGITPPCKFRFMKGYMFRRSDPAIFGIEILAGRLKQRARIMNADGVVVGTVRELQDKGASVPEAKARTQLAISMSEPAVGRQINEGEVLYSLPDGSDVKALSERYSGRLSEDEEKALKEIIAARRKVQPLYGF